VTPDTNQSSGTSIIGKTGRTSMNTYKVLGPGLVGVATGLAVVGATEEAKAFSVQEKTWVDRGGPEGTYLGGWYELRGGAKNTTSSDQGDKTSGAEEKFSINLKVMGKKITLLQADVFSYSDWIQASDGYGEEVAGLIRVAGKTVWEDKMVNGSCGPMGESCVEWDVSQSVPIIPNLCAYWGFGFVSLGVCGGLSGVVWSGVSSEARAGALRTVPAGIPGTFSSDCTVSQRAGGAVRVGLHLTVSAVIASLTGDVALDLIKVELEPTNTAKQAIRINSSGRAYGSRTISNREPITVTLLSGTAGFKLNIAPFSSQSLGSFSLIPPWSGVWQEETLTQSL
jgi:hypothetical protein